VIEVGSVGFVLTFILDQFVCLINLIPTTRDQKIRLEHVLIPYRILARAYDVTYEEALDQSPFEKAFPNSVTEGASLNLNLFS